MPYRIKTVSTMTGIPKSTLVAWERRYGLVAPTRADNGYREYSDEDVERLIQLKRIVDQGYQISEAVAFVDEGEHPTPPQLRLVPSAPARKGASLDQLRERILDALLQFDRTRADELGQHLQSAPFRVQIQQVWFPLLRAIGQGWSTGEVSIVQEHYASDYVRHQLGAMLRAVDGGPECGPQAVCLCFPGERHELGVLGLSVLLALNGWRVTNLGVDLPAAELAAFVGSTEVKLVAISLTMDFDADAVAAYVRPALVAGDAGLRVVIGGAAVPSQPRLPPGVEAEHDIDAIALPR